MNLHDAIRKMLFISVGCWIANCSLDGAALADDVQRAVDPAVSFDAEIQPLFKAKCGRCHGPNVQKGELSLQSLGTIQKGGESGPVIVAGRSAESRLFELVKHGEMPPAKQGTLTASEVELIRRWIDAGASFGAETTEARQVTQHDVIPILLLRCTACHGRSRKEGGLDLRDRESMLRGGTSGPAFIVGKPDESLMLKRIRVGEMPPHSRLTEVSVKPMDAEETKTLARWIELGAPVAAAEPDLAGTDDDPLVRPQDRDFWSLRPPQRSAVPLPTSSRLVLSPVDAFIETKLAEKELSLSASADRCALLRRIYYDLTGLPPSPAAAQEFLADESPDAFERIVDQLLASPRYGERWGRHWLDVAGYADCEGRREQHLPRPFAWRYRDYVIRSFNADKGYDRFLLEQIAGDELSDYEHVSPITQEVEDNLVATAFLRLAPDPTWANLTGFVPDRLEVTADSIDVLGSGVMGLTFKCARCHTHKFDPIPQRDYYRLVAIFKGAYDEHDWLKPQVIAYGGALSAGIGERLLPYVATDERRQWERQQADIQQQLSVLAAQSKTPEVEQQMRTLESQRSPEPKIMALWDRGEPSPTYIYRRGNYAAPGSPVTPGPPAALTQASQPFEIVPPWPNAKSTGRRLALARWLTKPDHPLTARVMINRIWKHHFGQGIVRSLGNFGKMGDRPTHPELLDELTCEFVRRDWSIKSMHRQLVLSGTYRQHSLISEAAQSADPANMLLSRMPLCRFDAEQLRDTILQVAGALREVGGGTAEPVHVRADGLVLTGFRRSIYVEQLRKHPSSLLESFDLPAMNPNCLQRSDSLVPTQALHLWNDAAIRQLAVRFADRVWQTVDGQQQSVDSIEDRQVEQVYWIALGRAPRVDERRACVDALKQLNIEWLKQSGSTDEQSQTAASRQGLTTLCHTILNSADFLYID